MIQVKRYVVALMVLLSATSGMYGDEYEEGKVPGNIPVVADIKYQYNGGKLTFNQEAIETHVQLEKGKPFKQYLADSSIRSLYGTGLFDYVQVYLTEVSPGQCDVTFVLTQKLRVQNLSISGNKKVKTKLIRREMKTSSGGTYSENILYNDIKNVSNMYQKKGFPYAKVEYKVNEIDDATVDIQVTIDEGKKMHVGKITFNGVDDIKVKELKDAMQTKTWNILSWLKGTGIFNQDMLDDDINRLKVVVKDHGYLDVEIDSKDVVLTPQGNAINITFNITEGPVYHFGELSVADNQLYPEDELLRLLGISQGQVFSPTKVNQACDNIRDHYGRVGYLNTGVGVDRVPNVVTGDIDLIFRISEGEKCFLHSVDIKGNTKTKNNVILRELALAPGDPFDLVRMKNSQTRLLNTRFFQTVDLSPTDTDVENQKDLRIEVKEANTGKFSIGGGISTGSEVVGFLEFSQSNFDLRGGKSKFQGAGQKFRARFQIGKRSNLFDLNFEEPWWYDRELAVGLNLFRSQQEYKKRDSWYNGASYDEVRFGGEVYLRKRLFGLWVGTATYHAEDVHIYHVGKNAPKSFRDEIGHRFISKGMFSMERDTRDNLLYPTSGSVVRLDTEVAGGPFFGRTKYLKFDTLAAKFWPTFELFDQI